MPRGEAGRVGYGWFSGMSVVQGTKLAAEAWEFCKFCGTEPGQRVLAEFGQTVPPMPRLANSDLFLASSPPANNKAYLEAIANVRIHPTAYIIESTEYNSVLTPALDQVWKGEQPAKAAVPPLVPQSAWAQPRSILRTSRTAAQHTAAAGPGTAVGFRNLVCQE
jgi:ABC-type glycerol-3-phosphate transport system substrate-binding protein